MTSIETTPTTTTTATASPAPTRSVCRVCGGSGRVYPVVELAPGRYGTDGTTAPCTHCPQPKPTPNPATTSARERVAVSAAVGLYLAGVFTLGVHAADDHITKTRAGKAGASPSTAAVSTTTPAPGARGAGQVDYRHPQLVNADLVAEQVTGDADRHDQPGSLAPEARERPRVIARAMLADRGWGQTQFGCLDRLWARESGWDPHADNPHSSAVGIPQAMASAHDLPGGYASSAGVQIRWGLTYIHGRYGTPCRAWAWWRNHHWY